MTAVAIDDGDTETVLALLRRDARIEQAGELKFGHFARGRNQRRLEVLARALRPGGMLAGRASIFMIDKGFFVARLRSLTYCLKSMLTRTVSTCTRTIRLDGTHRS
ncbi:hypothetical protein [Micromonospora chalcea]|uniref:hypothetical protein n=1 Tax=Micromonospora chalcea TaxID=1874 RepID=UPI0038F68330